MINVADKVKKAIFDKGWTQKKLCHEIDVTETGFKRMLDSNSWKLETLEKMAMALEKPVVFFIEETEQNFSGQPKPTESQVFGEQVIEKLKGMFEEELRIKNQQIAGLHRMLESVLGKSKGVTVEPLSAELSEVNALLNSYRVSTGYGELFNPLPTNKPSSKVGGTPFSQAENALVTR